MVMRRPPGRAGRTAASGRSGRGPGQGHGPPAPTPRPGSGAGPIPAAHAGPTPAAWSRLAILSRLCRPSACSQSGEPADSSRRIGQERVEAGGASLRTAAGRRPARSPRRAGGPGPEGGNPGAADGVGLDRVEKAAGPGERRERRKGQQGDPAPRVGRPDGGRAGERLHHLPKRTKVSTRIWSQSSCTQRIAVFVGVHHIDATANRKPAFAHYEFFMRRLTGPLLKARRSSFAAAGRQRRQPRQGLPFAGLRPPARGGRADRGG